MTYRIARNGQVFGPYTTAQVHEYVASGNILLTDLAQLEGTEQWVRVDQLFPAARGPVIGTVVPGMPGQLYPDPPDFPWWAALLLGIFTLLLFFVIWDIVQAAWLRRVQRSSTALWLYVLVALLYLAKLPTTWQNTLYNLGVDIPLSNVYAYSVIGLSLAALLAARFIFRHELLLHFNGPEPVQLKLSWFLTLILGGLYFQYHFNRINAMKRAMRVSVPG